MDKISIYGHSGSYNHGNEAVVRGLCNILDLDYKPDLYCTAPYIDRVFNLDERVNLIKEGVSAPLLLRSIWKVQNKFKKSDRALFKYKYKTLTENRGGYSSLLLKINIMNRNELLNGLNMKTEK